MSITTSTYEREWPQLGSWKDQVRKYLSGQILLNHVSLRKSIQKYLESLQRQLLTGSLVVIPENL